jgi:hypothetical protein
LLSVAEVRRLIHLLQEPEALREQRLWWSRFRRQHQAGARRCHWQRHERQAPALSLYASEFSAIPLAGVPQLSEAQWEKIRALLPKYVFQARRQVTNPRLIVEAILWVMGTGASWREIPARFGPWSSVAERYYRWCRDGKWALILHILQEQDVPISSSS